ncbi:MAG: hypothetical protein H7329_09660 [Opitutaceae bacterium]|nr:hypothetical protein [Cytophagales bacterium]
MKKVIIAISIIASLVACKKKKDDNPSPAPVPVVENPSTGGNNSNCQAKSILETKGSSVSNVSVTYNGFIPATIKVDSNGTPKINLVLDNKGSIKSGTIPVPMNGTNYSVDFNSTNTYNVNGLLAKAVFVSTNIPIATATITNVYTYDNNANLILLIRTTDISGLINQNSKDSILFTGYTNGRPLMSSKFSKDGSNPYTKVYDEAYEYDSKMNRTKVTRDGILMEENTFSAEVYPSKVSYLLNLEGNQNYGNKDQDVNFEQKTKTYKQCGATNVADISDVKSFLKSGSCITGVALNDTVGACNSSAATYGSSTYAITY